MNKVILARGFLKVQGSYMRVAYVLTASKVQTQSRTTVVL